MNKELLLLNRLSGVSGNKLFESDVLRDEVKDVKLKFISIKGVNSFETPESKSSIDVLLSLKGKGKFINEGKEYTISSNTIIRVPYSSNYKLVVEEGEELHLILIRKLLDKEDIEVIKNNIDNYSKLYFKAIEDCPTYKEDIKSEKTTNRMILPEGLVPRFAMGSVETEGPDEVGEHEHPMLDQIFFGLDGCRCHCFADGEETLLTENMMLHIPLASKHYVSVDEGDKLAYVWMDFFLSIEGEKYMSEQHDVEDNPVNSTETAPPHSGLN